MKTYIKRPEQSTALQLTKDNIAEVANFLGARAFAIKFYDTYMGDVEVVEIRSYIVLDNNSFIKYTIMDEYEFESSYQEVENAGR